MSHILSREFQCSHIQSVFVYSVTQRDLGMFCCAHKIEIVITRIVFNPIVLNLNRPKTDHSGPDSWSLNLHCLLSRVVWTAFLLPSSMLAGHVAETLQLINCEISYHEWIQTSVFLSWLSQVLCYHNEKLDNCDQDQLTFKLTWCFYKGGDVKWTAIPSTFRFYKSCDS